MFSQIIISFSSQVTKSYTLFGRIYYQIYNLSKNKAKNLFYIPLKVIKPSNL